MPCFHPLPAYLVDGVITLRRPDSRPPHQRLRCGGCLGCRKDRAREWAMRCRLELSSHAEACWCTLTYDSENLPPTLQKEHLSAWVKRLRSRVAPARFRFFATGEYGERFGRPHYHAILFGLPKTCKEIVGAWPFGDRSRVEDHLDDRSISYVAGYCSKKIGYREDEGREVVDSDGVVHSWQTPFLLMSRRPGIGGAAREFWRSWRSFAVVDGRKVAVPRFLHAAWKEVATDSELLALRSERDLRAKSLDRSKHRLVAGEAIAVARLALDSQRRFLE